MSTAKQRFITAYENERTIAGACRLAQIHRSTIHRWLSSGRLTQAELGAAWERGYQRWRKEVYEPEERQRQLKRAQRLAELREQRQLRAADARAAKRAW